VVCLSSSKKLSECYLKLGHDRFLSNPFYYIIQYHPITEQAGVDLYVSYFKYPCLNLGWDARHSD
jgi:hypothetical protein